jgi:hypothetical protein
MCLVAWFILDLEWMAPFLWVLFLRFLLSWITRLIVSQNSSFNSFWCQSILLCPQQECKIRPFTTHQCRVNCDDALTSCLSASLEKLGEHVRSMLPSADKSLSLWPQNAFFLYWFLCRSLVVKLYSKFCCPCPQRKSLLGRSFRRCDSCWASRLQNDLPNVLAKLDGLGPCKNSAIHHMLTKFGVQPLFSLWPANSMNQRDDNFVVFQ